MYGLTRATVTLIASAIAGFLIWLATQIGTSSNGDYWASYGVIAAAGLVMALSQLLGGWTKWGWPRISLHVFLVAFVPVAIAVVWIVIFHQPHHGLGRNHIRNWSNDIGIDGFVRDFTDYVGVLAFGLGLVFGYSFDTTGPIVHRQRSEAPAEPTVAEKTAPAPPRDAPPREAPPGDAPPRDAAPGDAPPPE
ncbi:MAG TPA: hypothetical protein VEL10_08985 [Gaiellaceae bacterium]|nr:hypothetical protein [Gaiellaceae bacterium]